MKGRAWPAANRQASRQAGATFLDAIAQAVRSTWEFAPQWVSRRLPLHRPSRFQGKSKTARARGFKSPCLCSASERSRMPFVLACWCRRRLHQSEIQSLIDHFERGRSDSKYHLPSFLLTLTTYSCPIATTAAPRRLVFPRPKLTAHPQVRRQALTGPHTLLGACTSPNAIANELALAVMP